MGQCWVGPGWQQPTGREGLNCHLCHRGQVAGLGPYGRLVTVCVASEAQLSQLLAGASSSLADVRDLKPTLVHGTGHLRLQEARESLFAG